MQCNVCANQDMKVETRTPKSGRNAGKPCRVYSCTTPNCLNDKGYPNSVWVPMKSTQPGVTNTSVRPSPTLEAKVDKILAILKENFPPVEVSTDTTELVNDDSAPF